MSRSRGNAGRNGRPRSPAILAGVGALGAAKRALLRLELPEETAAGVRLAIAVVAGSLITIGLGIVLFGVLS